MVDAMLQAAPSCRNAALVRYDTRGLKEVAHDVIRRHLRLNPSGTIAIGCVNDPAALGALQALRDMNCESRGVIVGQGGILEAREELRRPGTRFIATVAYFPETYGTRLIEIAQAILDGRPVAQVHLTPHNLLTARNIDLIYSTDSLIPLLRDRQLSLPSAANGEKVGV